MNLFLVTSRGLTATTWFNNAINKHQEVFSSHGRDRPSRGIETDDMLKDKVYRIDRLKYEQWQRKADINSFVLDLVNASNGEKFIGNVHGYVLIEIMDKISKSKDIANIKIANMIRHPIGFIESYTALVNHRKLDYPEKFYSEHGKRMELNKELLEKYNINNDNLEIIGFIEACQSLKKSSNEINLHNVFTIKMEEIVSNKDYFLDVFSYLTSGLLDYDTSMLDSVVRINSHTGKYRENRTVTNFYQKNWENWPEIKKRILLDLFSKEDIYVYQKHGYKLDFN